MAWEEEDDEEDVAHTVEGAQQKHIYPGAKNIEREAIGTEMKGLIKIEKWFRRIFIIEASSSDSFFFCFFFGV